MKDNLKSDTLLLVETSLFVSLSLVLNFFTLFKSPYGGSISLKTVPLIILALRHGVKAGFFGGFAFGFLKLLTPGNTFFHPLQIFLDYFFPYISFCLLGFISSKKLGVKYRVLYVLVVIFLVNSLRFFFHFISGILFFQEYTVLKSVYLYSFLYNITYLLPETFLTIFVIHFLFSKYPNIFVAKDKNFFS